MPSPEALRKKMHGKTLPEYREVNGHIHTPYSFSAFNDVETAFRMANNEDISVLGINDFFVTDGYDEFYGESLKHKVFPLFNIEFIGLLQEEQKQGIRINDPNNPGRIYFCGKGLDYPFRPSASVKKQLDAVILESQDQIRQMISRLNNLFLSLNTSHKLSYDEVKKRFAQDLVRERHLAKAVRFLAAENYESDETRLRFLEALYGGKKSKIGISDNSALENEIRSNLLKAGGAAFVEEDESAFLELSRIIKIIIESGGIPCYPVLLDDPKGSFTEFESNPEKLYNSLKSLNIGCIELIPGRNNHAILKSFAEYFFNKGFLVLFGTEHNTPEMIPLKVSARGKEQLDNSLKNTGWRSACVVAGHQYLRAQNREGYLDQSGTPKAEERNYFESLGQMVIEYFINESL